MKAEAIFSPVCCASCGQAFEQRVGYPDSGPVDITLKHPDVTGCEFSGQLFKAPTVPLELA